MKKQLLGSLFAVLILAILSTGCKKDDNEKANFLKVEDENGIPSHGVLFYSGPYNDDYKFDFIIMGEEMTWEDGYSGTGVYFYASNVTSSISTGLDEGDYACDRVSAVRPVLTFYEAQYSFDYQEGTFPYVYIYTSGFNVEKNGDTYIITIECEDVNGKTVTGYYKGTLVFEDFAPKKATMPIDLGSHENASRLR